MKYAFFSLLAIVLTLLNSCIDGEEEVFIKADGSARVKAVYRVPGMIFSAEDAEELRTNITEEVGKEKHLKLLTNTVEKENGTRVITVELEIDNMMELEGALAVHTPGVKPSKADKMLHAIMGNITVTLRGLSADLTREVDLASLLEGQLGRSGAAMLGESEFRYTVHLPEAVEESNAHTVENGGLTLKWRYRLSECLQKPIVLHMVAPIPLPWWIYAVGIVVLLLLALGVWKFVRSRARRLETAAT